MALKLYMQTFSGPVRSVLMTGETLGLTFQRKIVDLSKQEHLKEDFLKINPQHTIPTLEDHGEIIWDSHAINAYLVGKYGKDDNLYPKDLFKRATVDRLLHFDSGLIFSWLRIIARSVKHKGLKSLTEEHKEALSDGYGHLENFLKGQDWVTGSKPTIADFSLIANVATINIFYPIDSSSHPNLFNWLKRSEQLPCFESCNREGLEAMRSTMKTLIP